MMRPRATDAPQQKPTPRVGLRHLRTSSSDSITEKIAPPDRRSPRGARSDPIGQRKLGTRISDLETQLVQAQRELKCLKNQLVTADQQDNKKKDKRNFHHPTTTQQQRKQNQNLLRKTSSGDGDNQEVEIIDFPDDGSNNGTRTDSQFAQPPDELDDSKTSNELLDDSKTSNDILEHRLDFEQLKNKLDETEKERDHLSQQNDALKTQLEKAASEVNVAKTRELALNTNISQLEEAASELNAANTFLKDRLKEVNAAKELLEAEMKKLRVQTEQWRKAADAAATVLAGDVEIARCGSMDKQSLGGMPDLPPIMGVGRYHIGSPGDDFEEGKRKGSSGIRMFGDLWKKKGHK